MMPFSADNEPDQIQVRTFDQHEPVGQNILPYKRKRNYRAQKKENIIT